LTTRLRETLITETVTTRGPQRIAAVRTAAGVTAVVEATVAGAESRDVAT
jgi:hypothetical protein